METREASRATPVIEGRAVLVAGGGPAGFAAAVAAARAGASVRLLGLHGCLGGVWTAGQLSNLIDWRNKPGVMAELVRRLREAEGRSTDAGLDAAGAMKAVLERMRVEAGVAVRNHTRVVGAVVDDARRLTHVIAESRSGREAWCASCCIDATGDGDLAALAGCGFDVATRTPGRCNR